MEFITNVLTVLEGEHGTLADQGLVVGPSIVEMSFGLKVRARLRVAAGAGAAALPACRLAGGSQQMGAVWWLAWVTASARQAQQRFLAPAPPPPTTGGVHAEVWEVPAHDGAGGAVHLPGAGAAGPWRGQPGRPAGGQIPGVRVRIYVCVYMCVGRVVCQRRPGGWGLQAAGSAMNRAVCYVMLSEHYIMFQPSIALALRRQRRYSSAALRRAARSRGCRRGRTR